MMVVYLSFRSVIRELRTRSHMTEELHIASDDRQSDGEVRECVKGRESAGALGLSRFGLGPIRRWLNAVPSQLMRGVS